MPPLDNANNLLKRISSGKNPLLHAEAQRSLAQREAPKVADYPSLQDTASWIKKLDALPGMASPDTGRRIFFGAHE